MPDNAGHLGISPGEIPDWTLDPTEAAVWRALSRRRGRAFAVQVVHLAREVELSYRQTAWVVKRLREQHGLPILSSAGRPPGYYVAETLDELEACIREQRRKALSTIVMLRALRRHRARLGGQLTIGTATATGTAA